MSICIAVDAMGGDQGPREIIKGLCGLIDRDVEFLIFGDASEIDSACKEYLVSVCYEIVHCDDVVRCDTPVSSAVRSLKTSSMGRAVCAVRDGEADAVVSSGNTGGYMALAKVALKTIPGIDRPAIAGTIPGQNGRSVMLDLGANAETSLRNLVEFAVMGEALGKVVLGKETPSVSLLNIGAENIKGCQLVKNAAGLVQKLVGNYVGYVEGDDIVKGDVDVIVADGFSGNIALKAIEGTARVLMSELKEAFTDGIVSKLGACALMKPLKRMGSRYDPRMHNGAMLIGLNGIVVKSHGNSDAVGTASAVRYAIDAVSNGLLEKMRDQIDSNALLEACANSGVTV